MGGAVSSGRDNNELIDNLMGGNYIRTRDVERVFRALDRADYMTPDARDQAYKDLAWRNGPLHMSAPCVYSEVMEGLELKPGLSFLNIGSGTGYLSTLVGLIIGSSGISHGVECHPMVVEYANKKLSQFMENSPTLDEFDFCEPKFYFGNGLCLAPLQTAYDRVYCGAGCPEEYQTYFQQLIKVGGVLVMPLDENLLQVRRTSASTWSSRSLLNVSFATLRVPCAEEAQELIRLEEQTPARLQALCRCVVRGAMREALRRRHPQLREPPPRAPPAKKACPRRICIPIDDDSDNEGLNALHDLDRASGATEMNALLSLVLSMGHNRVAGALRVDTLDSEPPTDSDSDEPGDDDDDDEGGDGDDHGDMPERARDRREQHSGSDGDKSDCEDRTPVAQNIIMFGFRDLPRGDGPARERPSEPHTQSTSTPAKPEDPKTEDPGPKTSHEASPQSDKDKPSRPKTRRRTSKGSRRNSKETKDVENPDLPAEVEIYLEKTREEPGTSTMEWEATEGKEKDSSEEETETSTSKTKEEKRQKLDSGIGEENTPSAGSSPHTSKSGGSRSRSRSDADSRSDTTTDEGCDDDVKGRRRRQKRGHLSTRSSTSTEDEDEDADADEPADPRDPDRNPILERHARRHKRRLRHSYDARRVDLSILMKRGVKELPLPYALKKYVNLGRCFEF